MSRSACYPGFYCPGGAASMVPCPAGAWSSGSNASSASDCLLNSTSAAQRARRCPVGRILASNALASQGGWACGGGGCQPTYALVCRACGGSDRSGSPSVAGACSYGAQYDTLYTGQYSYMWASVVSQPSLGFLPSMVASRVTVPAPPVSAWSSDVAFLGAIVNPVASPCPGTCAASAASSASSAAGLVCPLSPACVGCPANYACADDYITPCPVGRYSAGNASACASCGAGSYGVAGTAYWNSFAGGQGTVTVPAGCAPCPMGTYSAGSALGATACAPCPSATYTSATGGSALQDCNALSFSCPLAGAYFEPADPSCAACPPGTASGGVYAGLSSCGFCSFGTYASASVGATACVACSPGTWSLVPANRTTPCE